MNVKRLLSEFADCPCGKRHEATLRAVEAGSGITARTGEILHENGFSGRLLVVADRNTLRAADGILDALGGFTVVTHMYDNLRVADMTEVNVLRGLLANADCVLAVGTGSIHDICRLAAAREGKPLCLFATAASMDGFASYGAPITDGCFKVTYDAKTPEVIIADTRILAAAPSELKAAGFGDMMGKYVGLIDWQVAHLLVGEYYCERVAALTREATDRILSLQARVQTNDEESARAVFEALLLTGIAMSFVKSSRPASGTEHILSHYWECQMLLQGKLADYHGKKVGVATLLILDEYEKLARRPAVTAHPDTTDYAAVWADYGPLAAEAKKLNTPPVTAAVAPEEIEKNWQKIREIVKSVPSAAQIRAALLTAGCPVAYQALGVSDDLYARGLKYHPYMRSRMSLLRLVPMLS
ncbi:MAG: sn-glycerol-1-phosphate dehydrogenase [Clostridiales bacterium]|jgi:glycerol-1-phosphate dehydrogenase [NAD(P)+]|nr:sn-glycerol-1-phosphate dehydrogenase [Clostridiales bacterium]